MEGVYAPAQILPPGYTSPWRLGFEPFNLGDQGDNIFITKSIYITIKRLSRAKVKKVVGEEGLEPTTTWV